MTEAVKHTPGPWTYESQALGSAIGPEGICIATAHGNAAISRNELPHEANARLIAAVPDLLEACMAFVAYNDMDEGDHAALMVAYADMLEKSRAAIAKAEGRS